VGRSVPVGRWRYLIALLALVLPTVVAAMDAESARFQRLQTESGLSQSTVMALAQDTDGRIWIGTQSGLNRYDGYETTVFRPDGNDPQALADNFVTALNADPESGVWVPIHSMPRRSRCRDSTDGPGRPSGSPAAWRQLVK
jgi:ligand-binding sensor domain-containing protein